MADKNPIDKLSIEISASSKSASGKIDKLVENLKKIREAMNGDFGSTASKLSRFADALNKLRDASKIKLNDKLPGQLKAISEAVDSVSESSIKKLDEMTRALERLKDIDLKGFSSAMRYAKKMSGDVNALQTVGQNTSDKDIAQIFKAYKAPESELTTNLKQVAKTLAGNILPGIKAFGSMLKTAAGYAKNMAKSFLSIAGKTIKNLWDKSAFKGLENAFNRVKKIIASFGRIAFYRAVRSAIKYVTEALAEGTKNAYWFAREFGDATKYIADAYDEMSSANFKMSNQLGAAWATMIATIEPIIIRIINLVTKAADAITQLFALLGGKGTYMKAADYNKKWADSAGGAAKAAKEWKNQLMGFDEINRLEEPSDGGGGGGSSALDDYNNMFVETPINNFFEDVRKAFEKGQWAELGKMLGNKVNELVNSVPWTALGIKFGKGFQAVIDTAYYFLRTVDFKNIGDRLSEFVNGAMKNVDFTEAGRLYMRFKLILWDVIYGAIRTLDWKLIARKLSDFILGALQELSDWLETLEPTEIATALKDFFGNIKYKEIKDKFVEVLKKVLNLTGDTIAELLPEGMGDDIKEGIINAIKNADFKALHNVLSYKLDEALFGEKWAKFWWSRGDYAGKDIVMGMINGTDSKTADLKAAMKTNVNDTLDESFDAGKKSADSFSAGFGSFASDIGASTINVSRDVQNMSADVSGAMSTLDGNISTSSWSICQALKNVRDWAAEAWTWLKALGDQGQARIDANGGIWNSMNYSGGFPTQYASGGFPEDGLFFANHGEMVGRFSNGRTAVANNDQIVSGISSGVFNAVVSAFSQTGGGNGQPIRIYLDGREIARTTTKYQNQMARAGA